MALTLNCELAVNYIINKTYDYNFGKSYRERIPLTVKRIQKLLYFSQIMYMNHVGIPMFTENFYAWPSGPVIPEIYDGYENLVAEADLNLKVKYTLKYKMPEQMQVVLDYILERTNDIDTLDLENISKANNSPWCNVYNPDDKLHLQIIPTSEILNYSKTVNSATEFLNCCKENVTIIDKVKTKIKEITKINCN